MDDNSTLVKIGDIQKLMDAVPKNSVLKRQEVSLQERIVRDIISDKRIPDILRELKEKGITEITDQQLRRVKRHVIPVWNYHSEPRILFKEDIKETVDRLQYVLDIQFKRIIEEFENELENQDQPEPNKYIDPEMMPILKDMLTEYHNDKLSDVDRKVLFSIMGRRGRSEFLFKEIQTFIKNVTDIVALRRDLGDTSLRWEEEEKDDRIIQIVGSEEEKRKLQKQLNEHVAKVTRKKKKN